MAGGRGGRRLEGGNGGDAGMPEDEDNVAAQHASAQQYDWRPRPDPTVLTTLQLRDTETAINRTIRDQIAGLRELMEQRLAGMDRATELVAVQVREMAGEDDAVCSRIRGEFAAAIQALRELLISRIEGMDRANELLASDFGKFPSDVDRAVGSLKALLSGDVQRVQEVLGGDIARVSAVTVEKFAAVDALFASNATALTAALAAQEKAVAEQNKSNTLAIDKSEQATKETIAANASQTSTGLAGLSTVLDDLKSRVVRLEGQSQNQRIASEDSLAVNTFGQTADQNRLVQARTNVQLGIAAFSSLIAIIAIIFAVLKK